MLESVVLRIPLAGRAWRRRMLLQAIQGMAALTTAGLDMIGAAEWTRDAARSVGLRSVMARFGVDLRSGMWWADAWERTGLGSPIVRWILRSAAMRENPGAGFTLALTRVSDDITASTVRLQRWLEPAAILACALVVGTCVYTMFSSLFGLVVYAAGLDM
jgi:type II secretory pathway component PulF